MFISDKNDKLNFAIPYNTNLFDWLKSILETHRVELNKITTTLASKRNTLNEFTGLIKVLKNADDIVDQIQEYELPKLTPNQQTVIEGVISDLVKLISAKRNILTRANRTLRNKATILGDLK